MARRRRRGDRERADGRRPGWRDGEEEEKRRRKRWWWWWWPVHYLQTQQREKRGNGGLKRDVVLLVQLLTVAPDEEEEPLGVSRCDDWSKCSAATEQQGPRRNVSSGKKK